MKYRMIYCKSKQRYLGGKSMLTSLGIFLRKLRLEQGEVLKDMADKLGVTVSFLSAVENGKKRMPSSWNNKLCRIYSLDTNAQESLTTAIADAEESIELSFSGIANQNKEIAVSFARKFSEFDDEELEKIRQILKGGKT